VVISGDDALDFAVRLNLFHLMSSVAEQDEAAVGARGLSGPAYRGHVFWDADLFALPFFAATRPEAARAMLEYRIRRLPAARAEAAARGRAGARFPWESSRTGREVTPPSCRDQRGRLVPIRTGADEEHIVADVAWAACCYADWTGDVAFAAGPGAQLLVETARYWVSRIRLDRHGDGHIYGVIGPDEYHEPVDDDTYTNVMARWNLRRAARLPDLDDAERHRFLELADALVDGYDPDTGVYEQFAGFHRLEPLVVADLLARPVCADLELGRDRVSRAQVVKQAAVVLAHLVVPDEMAPDSLAPNLAFYEPRTAHGSSLSPGVHAALFARTRQFDDALANLAMAARLDLDDLTGTGGGGMHLATLGSVWQAVAHGFAGLRPTGHALAIDPHLPPTWGRLEIPVRFRGTRLRVAVDHDAVTVDADGPALLRLTDRHHLVETGVSRFERVRGAYRRR
jgi:trehalose/maltose hydrolase-like predicted phosphorylase